MSGFLAKRGKGIGIRLGVKTSGCSGMAYKLEFADAPEAEDMVFESHGVKVLVDPKSLPYLDGTELDYAKEGLNEGFKFNNPNVKDQCGCGESFQRLMTSFDLEHFSRDHFALFGLPRRQALDELALEQTLSRRAGGAFIRTSMPIWPTPTDAWPCSGPRKVNEAYQTLKSPLKRARVPVAPARPRSADRAQHGHADGVPDAADGIREAVAEAREAGDAAVLDQMHGG